jgi:hypothetical protein
MLSLRALTLSAFRRSLARALGLLALSFAVALMACKRTSDGLEHRRVGTLEVAVLELEKKKSASRPGIKYEPAPGQQYVRVALHAKGSAAGDKLEAADVVLIGTAGTKASAEKDGGSRPSATPFPASLSSGSPSRRRKVLRPHKPKTWNAS